VGAAAQLECASCSCVTRLQVRHPVKKNKAHGLRTAGVLTNFEAKAINNLQISRSVWRLLIAFASKLVRTPAVANSKHGFLKLYRAGQTCDYVDATLYYESNGFVEEVEIEL